MKTIIVLLILGLLEIGKGEKNGRVVGGIVAKTGQYPYTVALKNDKEIQVCGGAILNNRWIISAASCITKNNITSIGVGDVVLKRQHIYQINRTVPHEGYNQTNGENNILLLETTKPIIFSKNASPINITADIDIDSYPRNMVFTGWGLISSLSFVQPDILIHLDYNLETQQECVIDNCEAKSKRPFYFKNQLCANGVSVYQTENGFCRGDTGGPLMANGVLYGIAARLMKKPCGNSDYPDVFTSIGYYNKWINNNING